MPYKKRILLCNDAHFLFTGYGKYGKNLLSRLHDTGKYELAELACYGQVSDPKLQDVPWKYYANAVGSNSPMSAAYQSHELNEFGKWRFERTCLDFQPDIVIDIRDPYMFAYEGTSPFRDYFHWSIMPTVDSAPQDEDWIDLFMGADSVFCYSEFGEETLKKQGGSKINLCGVASPGVDLEVFKPVNKDQHKYRFGLNPDINIVGTIMRNQKRKLYPDLFDAFRKFIEKCYAEGNKELADNTYLYVHSSYPDKGWDFPELLKRYGLGRKVLFTYICKNCNTPSCSLFRDARTVCNSCDHASAYLPNTNNGLNPNQLSQILNIFDLYIQYSVCEGFGMPQVEAGACGVELMAVDYSAMSDIIKITDGIPIPVERMFWDSGSNAERALPSNSKTADQIYDYLCKPSDIRRVRGLRTRAAIEKKYDWDITAKIWEDHIDSIELTGKQGKWDSEYRDLSTTVTSCPTGMENAPFVEWLICSYLKWPEKLNSRFHMKVLKELNYGMRMIGSDILQINQERIFNEFSELVQSNVECEIARASIDTLNPVDFIEYANAREESLR